VPDAGRDRGRILEEGKPADMFANPRTERLQAFLKAVLEV
jgi:ABC-type histidine transport system ATPase subunit